MAWPGVMRFAFNRNNILKTFLKSQGARASTEDAAGLDAGSDAADIGSNMWAFAPSRSQSGRTMLMGNPHQAWAPVSTYYEAQMTVPGKLNFYGSTFIGRPILTSGWNEHLGWSHTVNGPDLEEIYELDADPKAKDHYLFDGGSVPLQRDDVTLMIKQPAGEPTSETRTFWHTPLGPVVHRTETKVYVLRNACYENYRAYEQWLRMTQTKNFAEFRQAVAMNQVPMFNICLCGPRGQYLLSLERHSAEAAARGEQGRSRSTPRAAAEIWTSFHTTDELPQLTNPPGGYVQNCNSPPFFTNLFAPLDPARFPSYLQPNDVSLRTQHSLRLIHNDRKFTLEEICDLKHSPLMLLAERVKADLIGLIRASQPTSELEAAAKALEDWDNTVRAESRGGTLFANWWERYSEKDKLPNLFAVAWSAAEPTTTPRGIAEPERAAEAVPGSARRRQAIVWSGGRGLGRGASHSQGIGRLADQRRSGHDGLLPRIGLSPGRRRQAGGQHGGQFRVRRRVQPTAQGVHGVGLQPERRRGFSALQRPGGQIRRAEDETGGLHRGRNSGPVDQELSTGGGVGCELHGQDASATLRR